MRVLIVNTSERTGGAAIAASRLLESLNSVGVDARMLVLHKSSHSDKVIAIGKPWQRKLSFIWERLIIWINNFFSRKNLFTVSIANSGFNISKTSVFKEADIIHLHWINQGMLSLNNIREIIESGKPVVWTMHDMWECTSICHHAYTCERFKNECSNCPFLRLSGPHDLANRVFRKKLDIFRNAPMEIVTVSRWLSNQVSQSTLLKDKNISVIPNTLSLADFKMLNKQECRQELSFTQPHILLFGAARIDDPIKGFNIFLEAIQILISRKLFKAEELHLVLFGKIKFPQNTLPNIPIGYTDLGWVTDVSLLSKLYSAADVTISASFYETFGQTLIEAQACGCVPVSFDNSGQTDIIQHKENGYLARYLSAESLAEGIHWGLTHGQAEVSKTNMRNNVLKKYSGDVVAGQYIHLYQKMIKRKP